MLFATAEATLREFAECVEGGPNASLLVLSTEALPEEAREALAASAERLGYGRENVAWAETSSIAVPAESSETSPVVISTGGSEPSSVVISTGGPEGRGGEISPADRLRTLVEGLDPVALVAADSVAAAQLAEAYRQPVFCDAPSRVACRTVVSFANFPALMETPETKQKAWALLKELALK